MRKNLVLYTTKTIKIFGINAQQKQKNTCVILLSEYGDSITDSFCHSWQEVYLITLWNPHWKTKEIICGKNPNKRIIPMSQSIIPTVWKNIRKINNVADAMLKSSISHCAPGRRTVPLKYKDFVSDFLFLFDSRLYTYPSSAQSRILVKLIPNQESKPWVFGWKQWSSWFCQSFTFY